MNEILQTILNNLCVKVWNTELFGPDTVTIGSAFFCC